MVIADLKTYRMENRQDERRLGKGLGIKELWNV